MCISTIAKIVTLEIHFMTLITFIQFDLVKIRNIIKYFLTTNS